MALPQRDDLIEEIKRTDAMQEYAVMHGEGEEAERLRAKLRTLASMGDVCECKRSEKAVRKKRSEKVVRKGCQESNGKGGMKSSLKSDLKILAEIGRDANVTIPELCEKTVLSRSGVKKVLLRLKAAGRLRRIGPDKGGHWEAVGEACA